MKEIEPRTKLIELRKMFMFSQSEFAAILGIEQGTYSRYENRMRTPRKDNLEKMVKKIVKFCKNRGIRVTEDEILA